MAKEGSSKSECARLPRDKLAECLTCPLCNLPFSHPTAVITCLHTFCKRCIEGKIVKEQCRSCPICNTDIGAKPLSKLRLENSWNGEDASSSLPPPRERIEWSFSFMALGTPGVPIAPLVPTKSRSKSCRKQRIVSSQGSVVVRNEPSIRAEDSPANSSTQSASKEGKKVLNFDLNELPPSSPPSSPVRFPLPPRPATSTTVVLALLAFGRGRSGKKL